MDAIDVLMSDHQRVRSLFDQFRSESGQQQKNLLFENIRTDLELHTLAEETVFYPAIAKFEGFKEIVDRSFKDHSEVKQTISEISSITDDLSKRTQKVELLIAEVERHVAKEESELFPMVRKAMPRTERERLGRLLQAAKHEAGAAA